MSQHPIDDLFSSQLKNHEVKPERASWDELQRRINAKQERKTPFVWWYASAASVALLLLASWWLWSGGGTGKSGLNQNRIVQQTPKKSVLPKAQVEGNKKSEPQSVEDLEEPVIAYKKPSVSQKYAQATIHHQLDKTVQKPFEEPATIEKPIAPILLETMQKRASLAAEVVPKQPERTLVVQITAPETKSMALETEPVISEFTENDEDQPKKKRFRLGRVFRQFNKLKAGEAVEWHEVGVEPGVFIARASEKVQEGREKISDSYENLRSGAFRKNSNNK